MSTLTVLMSKSPYDPREDGETVVSRLLLEAAARITSVRGLALAERPAPPGPVPVDEVPKPPLRLAAVAARGAVRRRSLIHTRFAPTALVEACRRLDSGPVLARRLYMAEAALAAGLPDDGRPLLAIADVLESDVLRASGGRYDGLRRVEAARTFRDEARCARASTAVAALATGEARALSAHLGRVPRLDLVLPPTSPPRGGGSGAALFIGDLAWPPNLAGVTRLLEMWPRIVARCPRARLLLVGRGTDGLAVPAGVEAHGHVSDIDAVWASAGVLLAPVPVGGGVRVKILDAARRGVAVVASAEAAGDVPSYLPITVAHDADAFVDEATEVLASDEVRRERGDRLHAVNAGLVEGGFVEGQLAAFIGGRPPSLA